MPVGQWYDKLNEKENVKIELVLILSLRVLNLICNQKLKAVQFEISSIINFQRFANLDCAFSFLQLVKASPMNK